MTQETRILIADDHAIFRHGLRNILEKNIPRVIVGEVASGPRAVEQVRAADWDIVVLDVTMPGMTGVEVLQEIRRIRPALRVLMLSMHPEEQYAPRLLKEGAAGYITKITAPLAILGAIKTVLAGGRYFSSALYERLAVQAKGGVEKAAHEKLSRREYQIMCLIPSGKSLKAIAGELAVSNQTVSTHRTRLLKKLGLRNNAELIRYALNNQLVD